ncbi:MULTISPECIES: hypothetical protein [Bradyrhizobium]|nr:hypothetical protein [Bradyrhizobium vignae]MBP0115131.1 hypothetical protein [Bradyrhizobium vignae]
MSRTDAVTPLVPIVGLQDADKISHAGLISVFGHSGHLNIGCRLVRLPKPYEEIGDVSHGVLSAPTVTVDTKSGILPLDQESGGRYAAGPVLQLPARGTGSVALHCVLVDSKSTWLSPLCGGMS